MRSRADQFIHRHIGPDTGEIAAMALAAGAASLDALIDEAVPSDIRLSAPLDVPGPETEAEFLARIRAVGRRNRPGRPFIGLGYHGCVTPSVILRNVFENPGWYTPYTPYQAEVAQGRLEALLNFQTMVTDLTGMAIANASLLDEATAAAEAMALLHRVQSRTRPAADRFLVSRRCFPQTIDVLRGRAEPLGIEVEVGDPAQWRPDAQVFGVLLQYPAEDGEVAALDEVIAGAHDAGALAAVCSDLLALTLLTPPGEQGADVVVGNSQRFGVPLGYGGPHAAFFATRAEFARQTPGRIIGLSVDRHGNPAYRMALQTREQHIRRERATSNICTAQALLANIAGFYAVYHGPQGLRAIATRVHRLTQRLAQGFQRLGVEPRHACFFDTLRAPLPETAVEPFRTRATAAGLYFRYDGATVGIALDETATAADVDEIVALAAAALDRPAPVPAAREDARDAAPSWPPRLTRRSPFLTHPVFHRHRSETQMMRYLKRLEQKDIGLDVSMIPLGSCTMKLTAAAEIRPVSWPEFSPLHPFAPVEQAAGYQALFR